MNRTQARRAAKAQPDNGMTTISEAARATGTAARTIQRWAKQGLVAAHRSGKLWRVKLADVQHTANTLKPGRKPGQ